MPVDREFRSSRGEDPLAVAECLGCGSIGKFTVKPVPGGAGEDPGKAPVCDECGAVDYYAMPEDDEEESTFG